MSLTSSCLTATSAEVFGLSVDTWTAVASIAQVLAALGAIALLAVTLISQRGSNEAIEQSRRLATQTERLAQASLRGQALAVLPVIEASLDSASRTIHVANRGNGPLIAPKVEVNGAGFSLVANDDLTDEFREVGGLGVGATAIVMLKSELEEPYNVDIAGVTMTGATFSATVAGSSLKDNTVVPAVTKGEGSEL